MSARHARTSAAREARLAREAQACAAAGAHRRLRALAGVVALAAVVVVAAVAISSGGHGANAASGGTLTGAAFSSALFAGIPQHGTMLGRASAPVRLVEFADLQCPRLRRVHPAGAAYPGAGLRAHRQGEHAV